MINEKIFKSYDIRGTYPDQLNEKAAYLIGRAFARQAAKKARAREVVVGSDMRLSGSVLKKAVVKGLMDEGASAVDIGLVPIDAVYASVGKFGFQAGIMVTASHNPPEYNGFKMVLENMEWIRGKELQKEVARLPKETSGRKGNVRTEDILPRYIDHILSFVDRKKIKPFTIVVDAGNGMAGKIVPLVQKHLSANIVPLNFELDGSFPAHPSNPLLPESQKQIKKEVVGKKADFGVIFDGDTDRLFFVDEKGTFIRADITLLLLARLFLRREPGAAVVYNVICSRAVPEFIRQWKGKPVRSKVGFVNISDTMRASNAIMGGELSAHYAFRENAYSDSGFVAWLILLELLSSESRPLSEIVSPFYKYAKSDEINIPSDDPQTLLEKVRMNFSDCSPDELDGLTYFFKEWWFNIRPSNTEPLVRLTVEADDKELLKRKVGTLLDFLK